MKKHTIPFRRKSSGKTNYKKRLNLLKSNKLRLVVRKSNRHTIAQLIKYGGEGDKVLNTVSSEHLVKYGWKANTGNLPAAYLVGLLIGKITKGKEAILDLGLQTPRSGSRVFAVVKGAMDGGLKMNVSDKAIPSTDRISGDHITTYATKIKDKKEVYEKIFSRYLKNKVDPEKIKEHFEKTKESILK